MSDLLDQLGKEEPEKEVRSLAPIEKNPSHPNLAAPFKKGSIHNFGGNPHAKAALKFKSQLYSVVSRRGYKALAEKLYEEALAGEGWAMKELNDRLYGKAQQHVSISPEAPILELAEVIVQNAQSEESDEELEEQAVKILPI